MYPARALMASSFSAFRIRRPGKSAGRFLSQTLGPRNHDGVALTSVCRVRLQEGCGWLLERRARPGTVRWESVSARDASEAADVGLQEPRGS